MVSPHGWWIDSRTFKGSSFCLTASHFGPVSDRLTQAWVRKFISRFEIWDIKRASKFFWNEIYFLPQEVKKHCCISLHQTLDQSQMDSLRLWWENLSPLWSFLLQPAQQLIIAHFNPQEFYNISKTSKTSSRASKLCWLETTTEWLTDRRKLTSYYTVAKHKFYRHPDQVGDIKSR